MHLMARHGEFIQRIPSSLADGLLIWRCYNVWNRRRRVVLVPFLMLVTETLCGYSVVGIVTYLYRLRLSIPRPITLQSVPEQWWHMAGVESWVTVAFYALSLVTNVTVTVLIAWKIWKTTKESREFFGPTHGRRLTRVLLLMVESGAFYSLCLLLSCIFSLIEDRSTAWFVTTAVTNQVVGIAPTLIVILVSPHSMRQPTTWISVVSGLTSPAEDNHERKKAQRLAVEIPAENVRRLTVELTPRFDLDVELGVGRKEEGSMESHEGGR
ncbi:hypothetical protein OE88DRAFT_1525328 [Heliocybe sulcata]|uniref:Uncharacterized protein n=1 Tax=Heliocybe sulcata TaxID=5364 RepID=A0A5C3N1X8_9AGAM|nr:hypothetical protein OE88DRAFT_1525328 [Heliocybe sulcata]